MTRMIVSKLIKSQWVTKDELETLLKRWSFRDRPLERRLHSDMSHVLGVLSNPQWGYPHSYSSWWQYNRKSNLARFYLSREEVCCFLGDFGWDLLEKDVRFYEYIIAELEE